MTTRGDRIWQDNLDEIERYDLTDARFRASLADHWTVLDAHDLLRRVALRRWSPETREKINLARITSSEAASAMRRELQARRKNAR